MSLTGWTGGAARRGTVAAIAMVVALAVGACAGAAPGSPPPARASNAGASRGADTAGSGTLVPPGYGTLRQDDIALRLDLGGLQLRAVPLDERIIRVLSPDSYRMLHDLRESRRAEVDELARRQGATRAALWYVTFYGVAPEARFSPREIIVTGAGRDYRPLELIPLTSGFGEQRLRTRERQDALYLFDGALDVDQPLTLRYESSQTDEWQATLQRIDRERALIRSRAGRG